MATPAPGGGAALFTPPQRCAVARRPRNSTAAHNRRQCSTCTAVGRGVRHCCARRHTGHPPPTDTARGAGQSEGGGVAHPRGALLVRTRPQRGGGGGALRTPKLSHGTRCFVGAGGAGDFVLGIRRGEFFLFHPMCLYSKYSEFSGEFKNV